MSDTSTESIIAMPSIKVAGEDDSKICKYKTEDTGKIFEMAICLALNIPFDGPFKYSMEEAEALKTRLILGGLRQLSPELVHTAKKGARYDYTGANDSNIHLSAKTTKSGGGKVAPQVIGQGQPAKFCEVLEIPFQDIPTLKKYIQDNIQSILPVMVEYTFDCPNLFYNKKKSTIQHITLKDAIDWSVYEYTWTQDFEKWKNSSTLKIKRGDKTISLAEFQFHTESRTNMAIRWCYSNFIALFSEHLEIISI